MKCQALIAAVSAERGLVSSAIHKGSIDGNKFLTFLEDLRGAMGEVPFCLFMDNLSVHKTKQVKEALKRLNIIPIYNVPYSPDFNGIESFFSLVKGIYKKKLMDHILEKKTVD